MTTVQTLPPKAKRLTDVPVPQNFVEDIEEYSAEWYRRRTLDLLEQRRQTGLGDDDPLDPDDPLAMQIIVAICKEARAERHAENKNY